MGDSQSFVQNIQQNLSQNVTVSGQEKIRELRQENDELVQSMARVQSQLSNMKSELADLRGSSVGELKSQIEDLEGTFGRAAVELENMLRANSIEPTWIAGIQEYVAEVERGESTVREAFASIKSEYRELFQESSSANGFDKGQVETFARALDDLRAKLDELSNKINEIHIKLDQGVNVRGAVQGDTQAIQELGESYNKVNSDLQTSMQTFNQMAETVDGTASSIQVSLSRVLTSLAKLGGGEIKTTGAKNLINALAGLDNLDVTKLAVLSNIDWSNLSTLKVSKASLNNLTTFLPQIHKGTVDNIERLSKIDFSNLNNLKISKDSMNALSSLTIINEVAQKLGRTIETLSTAKAADPTAKIVSDPSKIQAATTAISNYYSMLQQVIKSGKMGDITETVGANGEHTFSSERYSETAAALTNLSAKMREAMAAAGESETVQKAYNAAIKELNDLLAQNVEKDVGTQRAANLKAEKKAAEQAAQAVKDKTEADKKSSDAAKEKAADEKRNATIVQKASEAYRQGYHYLSLWSKGQTSNHQSSRQAYIALQNTVDELDKANNAYKNGTGSIEEVRAALSNYQRQLIQTRTALQQNGDLTKTWGERIGGLAQKFATWFSLTRVIMAIYRNLKEMVNVSIELDSKMADLQIVTKATDATMRSYGANVANTAKEIGTSIQDLITATTTYSRLGYTLEQSESLAKYTTMLQAVGDIEAQDAQDAITAIIKAFDQDVNDIESVMNKLVVTGNNFPISVSQIAEGMNNASSALAAAGNSLDQSIALLTAANTTVQNASKASTGLRTIAARIRNTKAELDELGEEPITTAKYEEIVGILTRQNVKLREANGEYRSTYDIIKDIASVWDQMSSAEQAALVTQLAGTRQQDVFYSLINNFKEASGAMQEMANSAGELESAYAIRLGTVQAHLNQFKAAWTTFASDLFNTDFLKGIIDFGTRLMETLDGVARFINLLGGLGPLLSEILGIVIAFNAIKIGERLSNFIRLVGTLPQYLTSITSQLTSLQVGTAAEATQLTSISAVARSATQAELELATANDTLAVSEGTAAVAADGLATSLSAIAGVVGIAIAALSWVTRIIDGIRNTATATSDIDDSVISSGEKAKETIDELSALYIEYTELGGIEEKTAEQTSRFISVQETLASSLGLTKKALDDASDSAESFGSSINEALDNELNELENRTQAALNEAMGIGKTLDTTVHQTNPFFNPLGSVDYVNELKKIGTNIDAGMQGLNWYRNFDLAYGYDLSNIDGLREYAQHLRDSLEMLEADGYLESDIYTLVQKKIDAADEAIKTFEDTVDTFNSVKARRLILNLVPEEAIDDADSFVAYVNTLTGAAQELGTFQGDIEDIERSILTALKGDVRFANYSSVIDEMLTGIKQGVESGNYKISFSSLLQDENFKAAIDDYVESIKKLNDAATSIKEGNFTNADFLELVKEFPELADGADNVSEAIQNQIKKLTGYSATVDKTGNVVEEASGIIKVFDDKFGILETQEDIGALVAFEEAVLNLEDVVGNVSFSIDIGTEIESMENLWTAMKESVSATGLTSDSIDNLRDRYSKLEGQSDKIVSMFELTENGVHLNTKALRELEAAYESQVKAAYRNNLDAKVAEYNRLTEALNKETDASKAATLYAQRQNVLDQINDAAMLCAQYEGLTSAFNKWEQAQSLGEEGDMYDSLTGSLEDIKTLYDEGLIGTNKFRTAVQLMSNEDLSLASVEDLVAAYELGYDKMTRYFTEGQEGAVTFLEDVQKLNSEWAHMNEDGSWEIDFGLGTDEQVADALGINVEAVQSILRKLSDYGFDINLDSPVSKLDLLEDKFEAITYAGKEASDAFKSYGFEFDFGNLETLDQQITTARSWLKALQDGMGLGVEIDEGEYEAAQAALSALLAQKQLISQPEVMSIDSSAVSDVNDKLGEAIGLVQSFTGDAGLLSIQTEIGADTTEAQTEIQSIAEQLNNLDPDIKASLHLDSEEVQAALDNITSTNLETGVTINQEDIATVQAAIDGIKTKDIEILTNCEEVTKSVEAVDGLTIGDKEFTVKAYVQDALDKLQSVINRLSNVQSKDVTVTTYEQVVRATQANGTANVNGTAHARGDWATDESGEALMGELGPEIIVRDGKFFTVGDNGAEFVDYKKGDIIFNHKQTEELLKNGKVTSGGGRGNALVDGTAFSSGSGRLNISGSGSVNRRNTGSGSGSGSGSSGGSSSSDVKEEAYETIDWIEIAIDRIERAIDRTAQVAESAFKNLSTRTAHLRGEINLVTQEIDLQAKAAIRYRQEADSVGLSESLAKLVRNGTIDIREYDDETAELIKDYQQWYEKSLDCAEAVDTLKESLNSLYQDIFKNIETDYDNQIAVLEHSANMISLQLNSFTTRDYGKYNTLIDLTADKYGILYSKLYDLQRAFAEANPTKYSEAWYEYVNSINEVSEAIEGCKQEVADLANEEWDNLLKDSDNKSIFTDYLLEYFDFNNNDLTRRNYGNYESIRQVQAQIANDRGSTASALRKQLEQNMQMGIISYGSDDWYSAMNDILEKEQEQRQAILDIVQTYVDAFNDISGEYSAHLTLLEHITNEYQHGIDLLEANGYMGSTRFYEYLNQETEDRIKKLNAEYVSLQKALTDAVAGGLEPYSAAWMDMRSAIADVEEEINAATESLVEYKNQMREIEWSYFDYTRERISDLTSEAQFLIELLSHNKLFDDSGKASNEGMATFGLRAQNYNVYMAQADAYKAEYDALEAMLAEDPYNTIIIERRKELLELQRESILAAENEKDAIVDLVSQGMDLELQSLKKLIDSYKDLLSSEKDMYDYQKRVKEQTQAIATLRKQMAAYQNDTSEENRARLQRITVSLADAEEALRETEYERFITDAGRLLDNLYTEYEELLNARLDNTDALIVDVIEAVNMNANEVHNVLGENVDQIISTLNNGNTESIADTLRLIGADVGYEMTNTMISVWDSTYHEGIEKIVEAYSSRDITTSIEFTLQGVEMDIAAMRAHNESFAEEVKTHVESVDADILELKDVTIAEENETQNGLTSVTLAINNIGTQLGDYVDKIINAINATVEKPVLEAPLSPTSAYTKDSATVGYTKPESSSSSGSSSTSSSSASSAPKLTDEIAKHIAAALWNGNYGWDHDPVRKQRLIEIFGTAGRDLIQGYADKGWAYTKDYSPKGYSYAEMRKKFKGYKTGGYVDYTGLAMVHGSPDKPETFLNANDTKLFTALKDVLSSMPLSALADVSKVAKGIDAIGQRSFGDITNNLTIDIEHVEDYNDFVNQLKKDRQFEMFIKSMTIDPLVGGSSLAKNKYKW